MTTDPGSGLPASGPPPPASTSSGDAAASERLQAMLAQASQGQRDEQREITGALGDMRNQLLRLGQEIAELRATPAGEVTDGGAINNVTVELREAVRFLSERLDGVARMIAQRGEELADIRTALTAIDAHIRSQAETIGVLSTGLQALPSYGERVSALQEHIDAVGQQLGGIESVVSRPPDSGVNNRLAAIEASLARPADTGVTERLSGIEAAITPLSEHLAGTGQVASDHSAALAEASASIEALHAKVESLAAGTQAALATPPTFDDSGISALDQRMTAISADLASLRELISTQADAQAAAPASTVAAPIDIDAVSADDLDRAMRESEVRLRGHVDDAVMALAEALLRPRAAGSAPLSTSYAAPVAPVVPAVAEPVLVAPEVDDDDETVAVADDDDNTVDADTAVDGPAAPIEAAEGAHTPETAAPETAAAEGVAADEQWWEREEFAAPATGSATVPPTIPALDDDFATPESGAVDFSQAEMVDEGDDEPAPVSHFDLAPVEAHDDDAGLPSAYESMPPTVTAPSEPGPIIAVPQPGAAADPSLAETASWSPELPTPRPDTPDSSGTVVPERKRRFFGRDK